MYCMNCGKEIKAIAKFCPYCGEAVPSMDEEFSTDGSLTETEDGTSSEVVSVSKIPTPRSGDKASKSRKKKEKKKHSAFFTVLRIALLLLIAAGAYWVASTWPAVKYNFFPTKEIKERAIAISEEVVLPNVVYTETAIQARTIWRDGEQEQVEARHELSFDEEGHCLIDRYQGWNLSYIWGSDENCIIYFQYDEAGRCTKWTKYTLNEDGQPWTQSTDCFDYDEFGMVTRWIHNTAPRLSGLLQSKGEMWIWYFENEYLPNDPDAHYTLSSVKSLSDGGYFSCEEFDYWPTTGHGIITGSEDPDRVQYKMYEYDYPGDHLIVTEKSMIRSGYADTGSSEDLQILQSYEYNEDGQQIRHYYKSYSEGGISYEINTRYDGKFALPVEFSRIFSGEGTFPTSYDYVLAFLRLDGEI